MVTIIPESERRAMSYEAIEEEYDGKWVFMVKVTPEPFSAVPVVIADKCWEDDEKGLYKELRSDASNGATMHLSLLRGFDDMLGQY
jgi:hypothetical protein